MVPLVEMLNPGGKPVALNVYGPPAPPLPVSVTGVMGTPCSATIATQLAVGKLHVSEADFPPLITMGICLSFSTINAAVPVTTQVLPASPAKVPEAVTVVGGVFAAAVKVMVPGTITGAPPLQVSVKL
jgi:hypothetical protein